MINVIIPEMSCGHCEKSIRKEVSKVDQAAQLVFDLKTKQLTIESQASESAILNAIVEAGYQYESLVTAKVEAAQCCGHCS
jgi:copper chaperone